ncbi:MAG: hypothetical protein ACK5PS_02905 [Desulfopila sp.]
MTEQYDVEKVCLEVSAGVTAMVTHDLKNTLAIINENAGLLDDLAIMADDGGVPVERVQGAAGKVAQQVGRSNAIIKNLNRFAHSGDVPVGRGAVGDIVQLMVDLTTRRAAMQNIQVAVRCGQEHQIELPLLPFEALCYLVLLYIYQNGAAGTVVEISSQAASEGMVLRFATTLAAGDGDVFPGPKEQVLLTMLQGRCQVDADGVLLTLAQEGRRG